MRSSPVSKHQFTLALCLASLLVCGKFSYAGIGDVLADKAQQIAKEAADKPKAVASDDQNAQKPPPAPPKPVPVRTYALTVKTEPANATVSIRDIEPKYHDGIRLKPRSYKIWVEAAGYQKHEQSVKISNSDKTIKVTLKPEPKPVVDTPAAPTPAPAVQPQASPPPIATSQKSIPDRYIDHGNGTITDIQTRLMWKKCSEGQSGNECNGEASSYRWDDAMSRFGRGVSFAGYNDWRMPTKEELRSLVYCSNGTPASVAWDNDCSNGGNAGDYQSPTINLRAFPNTRSWLYWSSTPKDASDAWFVSFGYGPDSWGPRDGGDAVRLVRSGQ